MTARHLLNEDGEPFKGNELKELAQELDSLSPAQRTAFRNENAEAIATHPATQILRSGNWQEHDIQTASAVLAWAR